MHDIVIRGGSIVDGAGRAAFCGDIAIAGDLIVEVGRISTPARRVIDATGLLVTPGFVDIHTHYDGQASWDPILAPSSQHGVTSLVMGNCGVGFAPARPDSHDWLIALLEGVEDIPGSALAEGLSWDWETFPDYLDALDRRRFAVDVGAQVPHAALRAYVMGERGGDSEEAASEAEIDLMRAMTREAIQKGALGFTTSRTIQHRSRCGRNIGTLTASRAELTGIAAALKETGAGVIQLISDTYLSPDEEFAAKEMDLIVDLARAAGRPLSFTVQQPDHARDRWKYLLHRIDAAQAEGLDIKGQVGPRPIGVVIGLRATVNPFLFCATYRDIGRLPLGERVLALRTPERRAAILAEHAGLQLSEFSLVIARGFSRMFRLTDPIDYEPGVEASLLAEAQRADKDPAEHAYDVMLEDDGRALIYMPLINYARGDLADVYGMMTGRHVLYGLSDGGAHCNTICDASFPTSTLALWSRGDKAGRRIPLEQLVHGYTQRNARHVGWFDRGVIAPGYLADINLIDLDRLTLRPPELIQDLPAGGARLMQTSPGYVMTLKRGAPTFEASQHTGAAPGRLVRGPQDGATQPAAQ